jgi:hypothetical protein
MYQTSDELRQAKREARTHKQGGLRSGPPFLSLSPHRCPPTTPTSHPSNTQDEDENKTGGAKRGRLKTTVDDATTLSCEKTTYHPRIHAKLHLLAWKHRCRTRGKCTCTYLRRSSNDGCNARENVVGVLRCARLKICVVRLSSAGEGGVLPRRLSTSAIRTRTPLTAVARGSKNTDRAQSFRRGSRVKCFRLVEGTTASDL